jgi:hypothetical protein
MNTKTTRQGASGDLDRRVSLDTMIGLAGFGCWSGDLDRGVSLDIMIGLADLILNLPNFPLKRRDQTGPFEPHIDRLKISIAR